MGTPTSASIPLEDLPWRLFLDSTVLQALHQLGGFIYDGDDIPKGHKIRVVPNGVENVVALQRIMQVGNRSDFEFVVSHGSLEEVANKGEGSYLGWELEVAQYWESVIQQYKGQGRTGFSGRGAENSTLLNSSKFGYLSSKDKSLLADALELDCGAFITMDRKLVKNSGHVARFLAIKVLEPTGYWELLRPWAARFY